MKENPAIAIITTDRALLLSATMLALEELEVAVADELVDEAVAFVEDVVDFRCANPIERFWRLKST
jgi:hypothetical protein